MKYGFIHQERLTWPIVIQCRVLGVQRSGYYAWCHRRTHPGKRQLENTALLHAIRGIHRETRERYGAPRMTAALRRQGRMVSRGRVARLMKVNAIKAKRRRSFRITTRSNHRLASPNLLKRLFVVAAINSVWLTDITYLETREGFMYLATVLDLYSRKIIGMAMRSDMSQQLVIDALQQALDRRRPAAGLILHSDRGSQYSSWAYRDLLQQHGIRQSMSRKGDCWDNAPMESFFKTLKVEEVYQTKYATRQEAQTKVFEYIEIFYNRQRLHSTLNYTTPNDFEANNQHSASTRS